MQINDGIRIGGVFDISAIRGIKGVLDPAYKAAILEEGSEALIEHYIKKMGGHEFDRIIAPNRFVNQGLAMIVNLLKGVSTTLPTKVLLGSGATSTGYVAGDRTKSSVTTIPAAYATNGLTEASADSITIAVPPTTSTGDKLVFVKDFTASADVLTGSAPDEVMIRAVGPLALCYAPFPTGERTLANTDHLVVTYALTLIP